MRDSSTLYYFVSFVYFATSLFIFSNDVGMPHEPEHKNNVVISIHVEIFKDHLTYVKSIDDYPSQLCQLNTLETCNNMNNIF